MPPASTGLMRTVARRSRNLHLYRQQKIHPPTSSLPLNLNSLFTEALRETPKRWHWCNNTRCQLALRNLRCLPILFSAPYVPVPLNQKRARRHRLAIARGKFDLLNSNPSRWERSFTRVLPACVTTRRFYLKCLGTYEAPLSCPL